MFARHARRYTHARKYFAQRLFRSFPRSNHARFTTLSIIVFYPGPSGGGTLGTGDERFGGFALLSSRVAPASSGQGGCLNTQITPLDTLLKDVTDEPRLVAERSVYHRQTRRTSRERRRETDSSFGRFELKAGSFSNREQVGVTGRKDGNCACTL